jgi:hypothetical protein
VKKNKKNQRNKRRTNSTTADQVMSGPIKTTITFGSNGLPLEFLRTVRESVKRRHTTMLDRLLSGRSPGFVPISIARYVELHLAANPGTGREEFTARLRAMVEASRTGAQ